MNNFSNEEFDCYILDGGFTAKDILDQKINEVSSSNDKDALIGCHRPRATVDTLAAIGTGYD
jgi:ornithine decarboxylase